MDNSVNERDEAWNDDPEQYQGSSQNEIDALRDVSSYPFYLFCNYALSNIFKIYLPN